MNVFLQVLSVLFLLPIFIWAEESKNLPQSPKINLYAGTYINADLMPILTQGDVSYKNSFLGVAAFNYPLNYKYQFIDFETEAQIGKHFGIMNHFELNGVFVARINYILNSPFGFGFGEGLSYATRNPILENRPRGFDRATGTFTMDDNIISRPFLNYLLIELDYALKVEDVEPRLFVRVHHRSGIWGTFCPPNPPCGSNFLMYGIKFPL